ncbi:dTDP-4-amino-4,6-dideoxyglucose formyltransferase [Pelagicoccus sp. NFK12]|uniref:dTDP-4-amino-4,6-dideoxyglucose formyltransferase n=1 Tax=Pelagicoccus enzymogenes TaxID=2773457 RepID=A0A927FCW8_9BACT|nr:dTDP-4-amino-4,6-dideoxyglucose formyltransferase [Pelagicoccus enzymogenes]MBD5781461.1 dTDP-4-amino-4,6-dideoxyglucose formyltransferase [Pelagicoccus enzymogenes]
MQKILIISDNVFLTENIQTLAKTIDNTEFTYFYSSINKSAEALKELGAIPANLKKTETINAITSTFDLVISAHCKQIFPPDLVNKIRCINIHPGLNPYNRGWYPQVFSIINGLPAGCTIHEIDDEIDHGAIIAQTQIAIGPTDTSLDVYERVQHAEIQLISENLGKIIRNEYTATAAKSEGNYNSVKDFKELCKLDLNKRDTLENHINLLRALTHGEFKNAFYTDSDNRRIYISINISRSDD